MQILWLIRDNIGIALALAGLLGLCVGSFLNVVIYRTPAIMKQEWRTESAYFWQDEPDLADTHKKALLRAIQADNKLGLSFPSSRCPKCHHAIRFYENIPVISWIYLKGKCSGCASPISFRYPMVEIITALLSVLVVAVFGATIQGCMALIFTWFLVALTGIDFDTQLLPDRLVYPLGMIGLLVNAFGLLVSPVSAILGGVLGFLVFYGVAKIFMLLTKKEGMGFGDFKLLAAIGAWTGASMLPLIVLLSSVLGIIVGGMMTRFSFGKAFAFGPYIAIAGLVALLFGSDIMAWYLGQF